MRFDWGGSRVAILSSRILCSGNVLLLLLVRDIAYDLVGVTILLFCSRKLDQ